MVEAGEFLPNVLWFLNPNGQALAPTYLHSTASETNPSLVLLLSLTSSPPAPQEVPRCVNAEILEVSDKHRLRFISNVQPVTRQPESKP